MSVYNGMVQGLSKISTGTPSAFCRVVTGGSLNFNTNTVRQVGLGGQVHARKGTTEATLTCTVIAPAKTDTALWFPTTAGAQVASFPDFLAEVDDGTGGQEFVLSDGQPGSCTISMGEGPDATLEYQFVMKFATATRQDKGTDVPVYNSLKGHTRNDCRVQIAAADRDVVSWSLSNDVGIQMHNPMNQKTAGSRTLPDGYAMTTHGVGFSCVTRDPYLVASSEVIGDAWTPVALAITLANGTGAEDIAIAATDLIPDTLDMPFEAEGLVGFAHEFGLGDGNLYGRVTFA